MNEKGAKSKSEIGELSSAVPNYVLVTSSLSNHNLAFSGWVVTKRLFAN